MARAKAVKKKKKESEVGFVEGCISTVAVIVLTYRLFTCEW